MGIAVIENNNRFNIVCSNINDRSSKSETYNSKDGKRFYKIKGFSREKSVECIELISKDKLEVVLTFKGLSLQDSTDLKRLKLKGLKEDAIYKNIRTKQVFSGGALMNLGVNINTLCGDIDGSVIYLKAI
ncbi:GH36 C-terminal domain-containing protein [Clostridium sp. 1001271B_151109_B4]|uniref:GH36 C-terminal domain-containing protein n=1 Tax=Clostridium sp. 1001271B_151109_B4 TaxID=2787148 RepID=UPI0018ABE70C|nr:GH36 C-terminal domain-containing protein [Clostridium sp. 1001271B_151109_B4]